MLEDEAELGLRDRQALAGADEERHARPAPVLDVEAESREGLGGRVGATPSIDVAVVLAADVVRRVGRVDRAEDETCESLSVFGFAPRRRLHRRGGDHLHQVVDDDVAERSDGVVEVTAVLDAEVLGHRDLDRTRRSCGSRSARAASSRTGGRGSPRCPSSRGSGRCGRAGTRRCTGGARRRARSPTRGRAERLLDDDPGVLRRPAPASPSTTRPNRNGGISR